VPLDPRSVSTNRTVPNSVVFIYWLIHPIQHRRYSTEVTTTDKAATVRKLIQNVTRHRYWLDSNTIHIHDDDRKSITNTTITNKNPRTSSPVTDTESKVEQKQNLRVLSNTVDVKEKPLP